VYFLAGSCDPEDRPTIAISNKTIAEPTTNLLRVTIHILLKTFGSAFASFRSIPLSDDPAIRILADTGRRTAELYHKATNFQTK
jgi:hypothetical protein